MRTHCSSNTKECERRRSRKRCARAPATAGWAGNSLEFNVRERAPPAWDTSHDVHIVHQIFGSSAIDLSVVPGLSSDRQIGGLLYVAEPVHRSLENGHCIVSLTRGHCLQIYIEFECPIVFVNEVTGFSNIVVDINDQENSDGVRDALHINVPTLLTVNLVFDESVGLIRDENLAGRGRLFKPAREIYAAADDRVVHPIVAAEISDCTEPGVNSSSTTWRLFNARGSPDAIQFAHFRAHGDRHFYACHRIRLHASGSPGRRRR